MHAHAMHYACNASLVKVSRGALYTASCLIVFSTELIHRGWKLPESIQPFNYLNRTCISHIMDCKIVQLWGFIPTRACNYLPVVSPARIKSSELEVDCHQNCAANLRTRFSSSWKRNPISKAYAFFQELPFIQDGKVTFWMNSVEKQHLYFFSCCYSLVALLAELPSIYS